METLRIAREKRGLSQAELADMFGSTAASIANYESGRRLPDTNKLKRLSELLGCSVSFLLGLEPYDNPEEQDPNYIDVPLYGSIAAGEPIEMIEVDDHHAIPVSVHKKYPKAFLLEVKGESMNKVLPNGSYALIDPCVDVERDGKPYAVCVNGYDATIKRVRRLENGFELVPDSTDPTFHAEVFDYSVEGTKTITIIGRVVWYAIPYDFQF